MLDDTDRKLIEATQGWFPLTPEPYQALAEQLGLSADEVMQRLSAMQDSGIIRRIGRRTNHYKLGYRFNGMTVWDVPDELIDDLGQKVGNWNLSAIVYHRPRHLPAWPYNLSPMVHAKTGRRLISKFNRLPICSVPITAAADVLYSTKNPEKNRLPPALGKSPNPYPKPPNELSEQKSSFDNCLEASR